MQSPKLSPIDFLLDVAPVFVAQVELDLARFAQLLGAFQLGNI
jgi:hypothetical protein